MLRTLGILQVYSILVSLGVYIYMYTWIYTLLMMYFDYVYLYLNMVYTLHAGVSVSGIGPPSRPA